MAKSILVFLTLSATCGASAQVRPVALGQASLFTAPQAYQVVIEGEAALRLYEALRREPKLDQGGMWVNKTASGIVCGQNTRNKAYACTISVDQNGVK